MMNQNRSLAVAAGVIGAVAIAVLCAFTLPAVKGSSYSEGTNVEVSLSSLFHEPDLPSMETFAIISGFGAAVMALSALESKPKLAGFSSSDPNVRRRTQAGIITAGALAALSLPIYMQYEISQIESQARNNGSSVSLGTGLILASIAVVIGAVIPWVAMFTSIRALDISMAPSLAMQLDRLDGLRNDGALTEAEFQTAKDRLLQG